MEMFLKNSMNSVEFYGEVFQSMLGSRACKLLYSSIIQSGFSHVSVVFSQPIELAGGGNIYLSF